MKKRVLMIILLVFTLALVVYGLSLRSEHLLAKRVKQNIEMKRYDVALNDLEKAKTGLSSWTSRLVKDSRGLRDYNEGVAQFLLGEYVKAKTCFEKAFSTPRSVLKVGTLYNQGNTLLTEKDFISAAEKYIEALTINPDDFQAKINLEIIRLMQKQASEQQGEPQEGKGKGRPKDLKLLPWEEGEGEGEEETPPEERSW